MENDDELDLYLVDLQWLRSRIADGRDEVANAYELLKDTPKAREHLANAVGSFDTMIDRLNRLIPGDDQTVPVTSNLQDAKPRKQKSFIRRFIGV